MQFYFHCCKFWLWSTGAELLQCQILPAMYSLPADRAALLMQLLWLFITIRIFRRACMDLFMSLVTVAPSISTQMFIQKCLPSVTCTSFHSLFLIYDLKLIAKGSLSSLAVLALCWFMQPKNLLCIFKPVTLLETQDDCPLTAAHLCPVTTCARWKQWKSFPEQHNMPEPAQTFPFLCFQALCFKTFLGTNYMSNTVKLVGM